MHHRRIASFLIGVCIMGNLCMAFVATQNFRGADRILESPSPDAAKVIARMGHDEARMFLRYQAAEENRDYFATWEISEICIGLLLIAVLYLGTHVSRFVIVLCGVMVLLAGFMHFVLTPEMTYLGRTLDFVPLDAAGRSRFWMLHGLYSGLDLLKLLLGVLVAGYLFVFRVKGKPRLRAEVQAVGE
jgi:hypothetical protein